MVLSLTVPAPTDPADRPNRKTTSAVSSRLYAPEPSYPRERRADATRVTVNADADAVGRIEREEAEYQPGRPGIDVAVLGTIAVGGALGALARYGISRWIHVAKGTFPWATFVTNLSGAFILGLFLTVAISRFSDRRFLRPFFAIGFLGAFTTFSTMAVETVTLIKDGDALLGVTYLVVSIVAGLVLAYSGIVAGRATSPRC